MKISYNWLRSYLDFDLEPEVLCEILTDIGLEVEGLDSWQSVPGGLNGLVVGHVLSADKHPNADKLKVTKVDVGNEEPLDIVCGAPNVAAGQKVIVATVGTTLYPLNGEPFEIKKAKIRGEASQGMICAEDEIGLGESHDGIMVLADSNEPGKAISEIFEVENDYIIDIGLTPNRSDAFSHIGVAKDLKTALQVNNGSTSNVKVPDLNSFPDASTESPISVEIADEEKCWRYTGLYISDVEIKPSPNWLRNRLEAIGVRSINNVVDITNFVLHETGQPLHAFDADKITGKQVIVKTMPVDTPFLALDEKEYKLTADDLVIANTEDGMCIAGVFGGLKSGVTDETKDIFLESACFEPINTRKTSFHHLLRTDAAMHFEKGVDPNASDYALKRAALLMMELAGAKIEHKIVDVYPKKVAPKEIIVSTDRIRTLIGDAVSNEQITEILEAMEMDVSVSGENQLTVKVPTNKFDVLREADIVEEVLRIYGFNKVPVPTRVHASLNYEANPTPYQLQNKVADHLAAIGYLETMNLSISNSKYYEDQSWMGEAVVPLLNSLNADLDVLRATMLFGGLETILHNSNHQMPDLKLFEFGSVYWKAEEGYKEQQQLAMWLTGNATIESWRETQKGVDFYALQATVIQLLEQLGLTDIKQESTDNRAFAYATSYSRNNVELALCGLVDATYNKQIGVKKPVYYAEVNWTKVLKAVKKTKLQFNALPKYPSMRRDLALQLNDSVSFEQIESLARKTVKHILRSVNLFDIYKGDKIGEGLKSYAVSFVFRDDNKTLTDKQVDKIMKQLINIFEQQLGAVLR